MGLSLHRAPTLTVRLSLKHVGKQSPGIGAPESDTFPPLLGILLGAAGLWDADTDYRTHLYQEGKPQPGFWVLIAAGSGGAVPIG